MFTGTSVSFATERRLVRAVTDSQFLPCCCHVAAKPGLGSGFTSGSGRSLVYVGTLAGTLNLAEDAPSRSHSLDHT